MAGPSVVDFGIRLTAILEVFDLSEKLLSAQINQFSAYPDRQAQLREAIRALDKLKKDTEQLCRPMDYLPRREMEKE